MSVLTACSIVVGWKGKHHDKDEREEEATAHRFDLEEAKEALVLSPKPNKTRMLCIKLKGRALVYIPRSKTVDRCLLVLLRPCQTASRNSCSCSPAWREAAANLGLHLRKSPPSRNGKQSSYCQKATHPAPLLHGKAIHVRTFLTFPACYITAAFWNLL